MSLNGKYRNNIIAKSEFAPNATRCETVLPERLRGLRVATGYVIDDVARDTGISSKTIGAFERGDQMPSVVSLVILAEYWGVSIDWLCGRDDYDGK